MNALVAKLADPMIDQTIGFPFRVARLMVPVDGGEVGITLPLPADAWKGLAALGTGSEIVFDHETLIKMTEWLNKPDVLTLGVLIGQQKHWRNRLG